MKVTIEHGRSKISLFRSAPAVFLSVELTPEEMAIIRRNGFQNYIFHEAPICSLFPARMQAPTRVESIMRKKNRLIFHYDDVAIAQKDAIKMRENLSTLKEALNQHAVAPKQKDTFEL